MGLLPALLAAGCLSFTVDPATVAGRFLGRPFQPSILDTWVGDRPLRVVTVGPPADPVIAASAAVIPDRGRSAPVGLRRGCVVFVHGSPGGWDAWLDLLADPTLQARARLVALDRPGYGGSALPGAGAEPALASQAAHLLAAVAACGEGSNAGTQPSTGAPTASRSTANGAPPAQAAAPVAQPTASGAFEAVAPAVVVGHSLGGPIAARLALDRPELVAGLVLVAPALDPSLERHAWFNHVASWRFPQILLPRDLIVSNRELWPLRGELEALVPRWGELRAPTIVIQGDADRLVPASNADFAARLIPAETLSIVRLAGQGHFIPWERPDVLVAAILRLLGEPPSDPATPTAVVPAS